LIEFRRTIVANAGAEFDCRSRRGGDPGIVPGTGE
jgi:hypothetical protein